MQNLVLHFTLKRTIVHPLCISVPTFVPHPLLYLGTMDDCRPQIEANNTQTIRSQQCLQFSRRASRASH